MYKNLKGLRATYGLTQNDMAKILGISFVSYNQKEKGKQDFTLKEAKTIAKYFQTSIDFIFAT